ncbi:MAG: hypothetical protein J2P55_02075 [Rhizobiales bacterium]|nr:hypothetical protein [Hyphomicrobiales bacterium]
MSNPQRETRQIGLLVRHVNRHGTPYVEVLLCSREGDADDPRGISDSPTNYDLPKHLQGLALDGLGIYGFVSQYRDGDDGLCSFIGAEAEYRDVYCVEQARAERMFKTLKKINARIAKDRAYEPGDKFAALANVLRLDFVVEDRQNDLPRSGERWRWMTVPEGRNRYRELIEAAKQAETEKRFPRAKVAS